jgi:tetratricopeptide (TPR) repeat protein
MLKGAVVMGKSRLTCSLLAFLAVAWSAASASIAIAREARVEAAEAVVQGQWSRAAEQARIWAADQGDPAAYQIMAYGHVWASRYADLAESLERLTQADSSRELCDWTGRLVEGNPANANCLVLHADALMRSGSTGEAVEALEPAVRGGSALAANLRGMLRCLESDYGKAVLDLNQAAAGRADWPEPYVNRGIARICLGDIDGAIADLDRALSLEERIPLAYNARAAAHFLAGNQEQGEQDLARALELSPGTTWLSGNRQLLARRGPVLPMLGKRAGVLAAKYDVVIDIPGVNTQGSQRPGLWAPHLSGEGAIAFNIRHEGSGLWPGHQTPEDNVIELPKAFDRATVQQRMGPVWDAVRSGKPVYLKLDQNLGAAGYLLGKPGEIDYAANVADTIIDNVKTMRPSASIAENVHSAGTTVLHKQQNLGRVDYALVGSDRHSVGAVDNLVRSHPNTFFDIVGGDWDLPDWGARFFTPQTDNARAIIYKPVENPFKVHSKLAHPETFGTFEVRTHDGSYRVDDTLNNIRESPVRRPMLAPPPDDGLTGPLGFHNSPLTGSDRQGVYLGFDDSNLEIVLEGQSGSSTLVCGASCPPVTHRARDRRDSELLVLPFALLG